MEGTEGNPARQPDSGAVVEAVALLGTVDAARRRARDALHHSWLLCVLLGLALLVSTQVDRLLEITSITARMCPHGLVAINGGVCGWVVQPKPKPKPSLASGPSSHAITGSVIGKVPPAWSFGSSGFYWVIALAVVLGALLLVQARRYPDRTWIRRFFALAGALLAALVVDLIFRQIPAVLPLANVVSAGIAIGIIAVVERSRGLAVVGTAALLLAVALLHLMPDFVLSSQQLTVPSASLVQAFAGAVLIIGGAGLRWLNGAVSWRPPPPVPSSNLAGG